MVNNKVILIGRMTKDAAIVEPKEEGQGKIAHFSLAVDKLRRKADQTENDGNSEESTANFIRCTAFDKQVAFLEQYGKKAVKFALEGHLSTGSYEKDGVRIPTVEVIVENIQFCEKKDSAAGQSGDQLLVIPEEMLAEMPFK